jgi:hypothetical protein
LAARQAAVAAAWQARHHEDRPELRLSFGGNSSGGFDSRHREQGLRR